MKTIKKIIVLALLVGASGLASAQTTETVPTPMERGNNAYTNTDDDSGKWGWAGLLGLLGVLGLRHNREDHSQVRGAKAH